jgi:hypothetical protein
MNTDRKTYHDAIIKINMKDHPDHELCGNIVFINADRYRIDWDDDTQEHGVTRSQIIDFINSSMWRLLK